MAFPRHRVAFFEDEYLDGLIQQDFVAQQLEAHRACLPPPDPAWPWDIRAAVAFINQHLFDEALTVAEVKRQCAIRDQHLSARFANIVGLSPKQYIVRHRIGAAKCLLRYRALPITQIALALGYRHMHALTMAFRRKVGCTPTAFRNNAMRQESLAYSS